MNCHSRKFVSLLAKTPKRSITRFDFLSPSLTASTTASRSKMNRAASICNLNERYDSFTSLNSKATMPILRSTKPSNLFGGSLMNIPMMNTKKPSHQSVTFLNDDDFDLTIDSPLTGSLSSIPLSTLGGNKKKTLFLSLIIIDFVFKFLVVWERVKFIYRPNRTNNRYLMP